jgi:RNA recognition motif-containing protein
MVMGGEEQALAATEEACRVYVGNLLPKAKEIHLTSKFARFGIIHSVWIARRVGPNVLPLGALDTRV